MPERPLLILPNPEPVPRPRARGMGSQTPPPTNQTGQAQRIEEQFAQIQAAFISDEPGDVERVLVMETSSRIGGLQNAVNRIPKLEWLTEMDVDDIELHDLYDEEAGEKVKGGRFYILSSNRQATDELLGLWEQYRKGKKFGHGLGVFKEIFTFLLTLRRWDVRDRLRDTGILNKWKEEYAIKKGTNSYMEFEIELHYRRNREKQVRYLQEISQKIVDEGGETGQSICKDEIAFHALKVILPVASIGQVIQYDWNTTDLPNDLSPVFNSEAVRYFRPTGQHIDGDEELPKYSLKKTLIPIEDKPPVLALLDGVPMVRHLMLDDRIDLNDPDNYRDAYEPSQQKHGTAMASLICHGDLSQSQSEDASLTRRIYVRPVMKPNQQGNREEIPSEFFQEDIIERAVREMFEGDDPTAPGVRAINLSLGNIDQIYLNEMSPWARLLDWLAFKYKVLFIVSAGNYLDSIQRANLNNNANDASGEPVANDDRQQVLGGIDVNQRNHRLFSPAESMNALTVGALQGDAFGDLPDSAGGADPIENMGLPAPYSRIGPGYRSAIKPDVFAQGGRLLYEQDQTDANSIGPLTNNEPPGVQIAYPGAMPEQLSNTAYGAGTSHATAIVSHGAGHIFEMLEEIRAEHDDILASDFDAVLIKTLLVHSASRGGNSSAYEHLKNSTNQGKFKRYLSRYLGYGNVNIERVLECTRVRATAVGCGRIQMQQRHRFTFPLPANTLTQSYARLTVTLAWFSPINPHHIGLRRAKLFFEGSQLSGAHGNVRQEADWQQVRKGTVQHEVFDLDKNSFPGESLELFVQCAADAGTLDDEIPYGLAVTLEIAEQETIDLYQVVRDNIRLQITPSGG